METARDGWMDGASGACNWKSSILSQIFRQHVFNMFCTKGPNGAGKWSGAKFRGSKIIPVSGSTCNYPGLIALIFDVMAGELRSLSTGSWSKFSSFCSRVRLEPANLTQNPWPPGDF